MTIHVCLRRFAGIAADSAAALMGIQDIAAQQFEEIVVTARKRDESVLEIPIAVSAYSQDDLDALGMNTIEQLSSVTTGFTLQNVSQGGMGGRHNPNIRFRGLGVQVESPASRAGSVFWKRRLHFRWRGHPAADRPRAGRDPEGAAGPRSSAATPSPARSTTSPHSRATSSAARPPCPTRHPMKAATTSPSRSAGRSATAWACASR